METARELLAFVERLWMRDPISAMILLVVLGALFKEPILIGFRRYIGPKLGMGNGAATLWGRLGVIETGIDGLAKKAEQLDIRLMNCEQYDQRMQNWREGTDKWRGEVMMPQLAAIETKVDGCVKRIDRIEDREHKRPQP